MFKFVYLCIVAIQIFSMQMEIASGGALQIYTEEIQTASMPALSQKETKSLVTDFEVKIPKKITVSEKNQKIAIIVVTEYTDFSEITIKLPKTETFADETGTQLLELKIINPILTWTAEELSSNACQKWFFIECNGYPGDYSGELNYTLQIK